MAGNKEGGAKTAATNKLRHGEGFYARIGSMGGKVSKRRPAGSAWSLADDIKAERAKSWRGRIFNGRFR